MPFNGLRAARVVVTFPLPISHPLVTPSPQENIAFRQHPFIILVFGLGVGCREHRGPETGDRVNLASFFTAFKNQFPTQYNRQVSTAHFPIFPSPPPPPGPEKHFPQRGIRLANANGIVSICESVVF